MFNSSNMVEYWMQCISVCLKLAIPAIPHEIAISNGMVYPKSCHLARNLIFYNFYSYKYKLLDFGGFHDWQTHPTHQHWLLNPCWCMTSFGLFQGCTALSTRRQQSGNYHNPWAGNPILNQPILSWQEIQNSDARNMQERYQVRFCKFPFWRSV